jgi:pimeloyl-ACP methyl ester carboxylesterase
MSRRTLTLVLTAPLLIGVLTAVRAPAAAALTFGACENSPGFSCATVPVPLDRSGLLGGTISLSVERKAAGATHSQNAVVALAGGPGQAALPLGEFISKALAPALSSRDLLVFDQRGTGASDPLSCTALSSFATGTVGRLLERCAHQIGPARGAYTTPESVGDIEALRQAAGYEKLVLYGTSYGTKVALEYAKRYPERVEALVLDSVVPSDGPEPFDVPTFQAIGSVLAELCSNHACAGITSNPLADVASLAARLRKHTLSGSAYDGSGHRSSATLRESGLLEVLQAGDLNPALRALLPASVRSALRHDPDPLLRLHLLSQGLIPSVPKRHVENVEISQSIDEALFVTTSCEETPFPWQRAGSPSTRLSEALAALHALPRADFYPFDASTALADGLITACASWPDASAAPPPPGPLPNVPTLILSGAQDLRTPTSAAKALAALIPDAQLVVVPHTGHSVIGSDFSGCAEAAVTAFFAGSPVTPCTSSLDVFSPTPIAPTKLAHVHSPPGLGGKPGRTLTAVLDAIVDLNRQVIAATLQANQELPSGSSFGGLRGGYAKLTASAAIMKRFSFVAGVQLNGTFPVRDGELQPATIRISGAEASPGTVRFRSDKQVTGTLGGRRFDVSLAKVKLSRAPSAGEWPSHAVAFPLPGLVEGRPGRPR